MDKKTPKPKPNSNKNKHKEKREARKQEQRRIADGMSLVSAANKIIDLTEHLQDLMITTKNGKIIEFYVKKVADLEKSVLDWVIDLTERNMKRLYETCSWGWNKEKKVNEMTEADLPRYLIINEKDGAPLAFSHFRFDMDEGVPVLYCYELQVEEEGRRQGLGHQALQLLERLARVTHMHQVRLTVLKHNPSALLFFEACGYTEDETSPAKEDGEHYEILSKDIV